MEFLSFKKIIVFGSESVGKSSLTSRLEQQNFTEEPPSNSSNFI